MEETQCNNQCTNCCANCFNNSNGSGGSGTSGGTGVNGSNKIQITWEDGLWSKRTFHSPGDVIQSEFIPPTNPPGDFIGWFIGSVNGEQISFPFRCEKNITVFAKWRTTEHTVTYNGPVDCTVNIMIKKGDQTSEWISQKVPHGATIKSLIIPEQIGYQFIGWFDDADNPFSNSFPINHDLDVYAHFDLIKYDLMWDLGGHGEITSPVRRKYTVLDWDSDTITQGVVPVGYEPTIEFSGWDGNKIPVGTTGDFTFTAKWKTRLYTVTWVNGEIPLNTLQFEYGHVIQQSDFPPDVFEGHTFLGWKEEGSDGFIEIPYVVDKNATLVAQWKINTYNVILHYRGEDGEYKTFSQNYEWNFELTKAFDVPSGYQFIGWYTGKDSGLQVSMPVTVNQHLELWAWYKGGYEVTFDPNGGVFNKVSMPFSAGQKFYSLCPTPNMTGYAFVKWTTDSGSDIDNNYVVDGNMDVYANWSEDWVSVILHGNGGTWNKYNLFPEQDQEDEDSGYIDGDQYRQNVLRGVQFILDSIPFERPGYQFIGWSKNGNSTQPDPTYGYFDDDENPVMTQIIVQDDNTNLYAVWKPITLTFTFDPCGGMFQVDTSGGTSGSGVLSGRFLITEENASTDYSEKPILSEGQTHGERLIQTESLVREDESGDNVDDVGGGEQIQVSNQDVFVLSGIRYMEFPNVDAGHLNPVRDGYVFNGWYDKDGGKRIDRWDFYATKSMDLIAKWTPVDVTPEPDIPQVPDTPNPPPSTEQYNIISPKADAGNKFKVVGSSNPCSAKVISTRWSGPSGGALLHSCTNYYISCPKYTIGGQSTLLYQCTQFPGEYYYKVDILPGEDRPKNSSAVVGSSSRPVWNRKGYKFLGWMLIDAYGQKIQLQPSIGYYKTNQKKKLSVYINRRYAHSIEGSYGSREGFEFYAVTKKI